MHGLFLSVNETDHTIVIHLPCQKCEKVRALQDRQGLVSGEMRGARHIMHQLRAINEK